MPTKTMLRSAELSSSLDRAPGLDPERPHAESVWAWRDWVTSDWNDEGQLEWLAEQRRGLGRGGGGGDPPGGVALGGGEPAHHPPLLPPRPPPGDPPPPRPPPH